MKFVPRSTAAVVLLTGAAALSGCANDGPELKDATDGNPFKGSARVDFPIKQTLSKLETLRITVRNNETRRAWPNVSVTVKGLDHMIPREDNGSGAIADPRRPNWIVDSPPPGGASAYSDTWSLGRLAAGQDKVFEWKLTPVRAGSHKISWSIAGATDEKGTVEPAPGGEVNGSFDVTVK